MLAEIDKLVFLEKKIICFGTGSALVHFLELYPFCNAELYVDNDRSKAGSILHGKKIYNPEIFSELDMSKYIVIITSSFENEIADQLQEMKLKENENFFKSTTVNKIFNKFIVDGHYYSVVPNLKELLSDSFKEYEKSNEIAGIDLKEENQLQLLKKFLPSIEEYKTVKKNRYEEINKYFPLGDAVVIYSMLKNEVPRKIIEVGSGFSSAVFLDSTDELGIDVEFTFIEPNPQRLLTLLNENDKRKCTILKNTVQEIPLSVFKELREGDILFIDGSHVSKIESDVNYIIFEVLPTLHKGVRIHFHDIFYPFEYPKDWLEKGLFWNEAYLLRGFLQYNSTFEIEFWGNCINRKISPEENTSFGGSIWLRKVK